MRYCDGFPEMAEFFAAVFSGVNQGLKGHQGAEVFAMVYY